MSTELRKLQSAFILEHFDLMDDETRVALDEADGKNQMILSLTSRLYDKIVEKVDQIDYGTIPNSKGDITKVDNYNEMLECIEIMKGILDEYHEDKEPLDTISTAIDNIKSRTKTFEKAYALNVELPIVLYNTMVLAVVGSISFLIATCIEFIKQPGDDSFAISLDKAAYYKEKENLLLNNLRRFNKSCQKGEIDAALDTVFAMNAKNLAGSVSLASVGGIALIGLCFCIVPMLQELVYFYYHMRQSVSDYFAIQAELLDMNYNNVQYRTDISAADKKMIVSKQKKISDGFKKTSQFFAVKAKSANKDTSNSIKTTEKYTKAALDSPMDRDDSDSLF